MVTVLVTACPEPCNHLGRGTKDDATEFDVSLSLRQTYYFYHKSILFAHLFTQGFILKSLEISSHKKHVALLIKSEERLWEPRSVWR
jgi:hypothetical protein